MSTSYAIGAVSYGLSTRTSGAKSDRSVSLAVFRRQLQSKTRAFAAYLGTVNSVQTWLLQSTMMENQFCPERGFAATQTV